MDTLIVFMMTLAMMAGFMLIIRRPLLWYLRINERIDNQRQIIEQLKLLNDKQQSNKSAVNADNRKDRHRRRDRKSHHINDDEKNGIEIDTKDDL